MKVNFGKMLKTTKRTMVKHAPEILVGAGIAGFASTVVMAVKATPKALELIEEEKEAQGVEELSKGDIVKATWKVYVPAAATAVLSTACIISSNRVSSKRITGLSAAYAISEKTLSDYKEKVIETIGEKKEKEVRDKVAEKKLNENPVSKNEVVITGTGTTLCYDTMNARYFESDLETIRRAINNLNEELLNSMYVSLNEFYDELDLKHTRLGYELGWRAEDGLIRAHFSSHIADNGKPAIVIDFDNMPKYDYNRIS